jgi:hypothetical protein
VTACESPRAPSSNASLRELRSTDGPPMPSEIAATKPTIVLIHVEAESLA